MELITKFEHDEKIIGWVHSHVRGIKCFFSSLDVHNQYLSQRLDSNHLGLVVQIHPDGTLVDHDYYQLTSLGMTTVTNCLNGSTDNSKQHPSCGGDNLYMSQRHLVVSIADLPLTINVCQQIEVIAQRKILNDPPKKSIQFSISERVLRPRNEKNATKQSSKTVIVDL